MPILHRRRMARQFALVALALLATVLSSCHQQLPPGTMNEYRPYGIRHAIVHMEYFGNARGTEDLYIDSFGRMEAHAIHTERATERGFSQTVTYTVKRGSSVVIIDSILMREVHMVDSMADSLFRLTGTVPPSEEVVVNTLLSLGFGTIGTATRCGIPITIWKKSDAPVFLQEFRGILVGRMAGTPEEGEEMRLISIDTVTPIDRARFEVPKGFPVVDGSTIRVPRVRGPDADRSSPGMPQ